MRCQRTDVCLTGASGQPESCKRGFIILILPMEDFSVAELKPDDVDLCIKQIEYNEYFVSSGAKATRIA